MKEQGQERSKKILRSDTHRGLNEEFINLSLEEMSAHVTAGQRRDRGGSCVVLLLFFLLIAAIIGVGIYYYGPWFTETWNASRQVASSVWNLKFWEAFQLVFAYRVSFLIIGIFVGIVIALFTVFQLGEMILDLAWNIVSAPFS